MDDAQLQTIWQQRRWSWGPSHLSEPLALLMKHSLGKKVRQLSKLAEVWDQVVPEHIAQHTALEGFSRGVLTVTVDSAAHRFQLHTLLEGGLRQAIRERFGGPLNKIHLVPGQICTIDAAGSQRYDL